MQNQHIEFWYYVCIICHVITREQVSHSHETVCQLSNSSQASENGGLTVIPDASITSDKEIMFSLAFACRCVIILFVNMIVQFFNDIWLNFMGVQSGVLFTIH